MNLVILMGRLTKDPELRTTTSQIPVATFTVAVDRQFKDSSGNKQTDFFPIVAWRNQADFASKYFKKGDKILVSGSLQVRSWDDTDGKKHTVTEVVADSFEFCEPKTGKPVLDV